MPARIVFGKKRHKYNAKKTVGASGRTYPSKKEAKRADVLALQEMAGEIRNLQEQVPVTIFVNGQKICAIILDFVYEENGAVTYEDCKGFRTETYRLKAKLFKAVMGQAIKET